MKNQNKDNLLYFADDEIVTGKTENKKVFVTKRINGKETHLKQEINRETEYKRIPNTQGFNFEREIVIGVNSNKKSTNNKSFNEPKKAKRPNVNNKSKESKNLKTNQKKKNLENTKKSKEAKNTININSKKRINEKYYEDFNKVKNTKRNSKGKNNKIFITTISILFMLISLCIMTLLTPLFNINEIKVEGNNKVTSANIINLSKLKMGQNIFKNNKGKIKKYIKENAYIEDVKIKRILPSTIEINVVERKIEYQIQLISSYIYIDGKGNILEKADTKENAVVLDGFFTSEEQLTKGKKLDNIDLNKISNVNDIKNAISQIEGLQMSDIKINIKKDNDYIIYLNSEKKKIYIGDSSNLLNKMLYIKKILENEKENQGSIFINGNLNEGFKPYFREEEYKE